MAAISSHSFLQYSNVIFSGSSVTDVVKTGEESRELEVEVGEVLEISEDGVKVEEELGESCV